MNLEVDGRIFSVMFSGMSEAKAFSRSAWSWKGGSMGGSEAQGAPPMGKGGRAGGPEKERAGGPGQKEDQQ